MRVTASALCLLATLSSFPKGISAQQEICNSFSGSTAANDAVKWCSSPDRTTKCCTNDAGDVSSDACGNWGSNTSYNLCEGSCQGTNSCVSMLTSAAAGSSISIKEGGCVDNSSCRYFAQNANGVVSASIGKGSCSGGDDTCYDFLYDASGDITVDIQDQACQGESACEEVGADAENLTSLTVPTGECSADNACASCVKDNKSDGGLAVTTACCASNVDDACLYSDVPSSIPSSSSVPSSQPSNVPSLDDKKKKKTKGGKAAEKKNKKVKGGKAAEKKNKKVKGGKTTKAKKDVVQDVIEGDADDIGFTNTPDVVDIEVAAGGNIRN